MPGAPTLACTPRTTWQLKVVMARWTVSGGACLTAVDVSALAPACFVAGRGMVGWPYWIAGCGSLHILLAVSPSLRSGHMDITYLLLSNLEADVYHLNLNIKTRI